ncbi:MAG: hypothetical protein AVDCRST_MAG03-2678 [uncultured Rubrobacteraceae bacterium]|uniref:Uncharacterized protein n=1 Tax=uncultured Rubrobacteraceae bacterium TaxID=349277 RepID=A0A6J4PS93_9ACTN|nr:MAG: hypothetical protein AVDCRST_MAG03-2678 [uncultured Rubrobacteraceae bacterium]
MGLAIVALIVLAIVAFVAIPILIRVFGEATSRNENRPDGQGRDEPRPGERGPGGEE